MQAADFEGMMRGMAEAKAFLEKNEHDGFVVHEPEEARMASGIKDVNRKNDR